MVRQFIVPSIALVGLIAISESWAAGQSPTEATREQAEADGRGLRLIVSDLPLNDLKLTNQSSWSSLTPGTELKFYCSTEALAGVGAKSESLAIRDVDMKGPVPICSESRFFGGRESTIRVVLVQRSTTDQCEDKRNVPALEVNETERKTLLALQFKQILSGLAPMGVSNPPVCKWAWPDIQLTKSRGVIVIGAAADAEAKKTAVTRSVFGSPEHFFFSADAVVKGVKQLSYNQEKKTVFHRDSPDQIYLGFNGMLGDVYGRHPAFSHRRIVLKLNVLAAKRPFDSTGIGIGYRFANIFSAEDLSGKDSSGFVLYVGHYWTKADSKANDAEVNSSRAKSTRIGLSYSLGTALEWLK